MNAGEGKRCPGCGATAAGRMQVPEIMFGLDEQFEYVCCEACGSVALAEPIDALENYYPTDYYSIDLDPERTLGRLGVRHIVRQVGRSILMGEGRRASVATRVIARRQFHTLVSLFRSVKLAGLSRGEDTSILDVGCGSGMLVYALGLSGLTRVTGLDPFLPVNRQLDTGSRLYRRGLEEVDGPFDVIMFHHSLEHVPNIEASLRQARSLLTPDGRVLIRMPTVSSDAFDRYRAGWVQLDAPRHTAVLSRSGVESVALRAGLRVEEVKDDSTSFQFWGSEQVLKGVPLMSATSHMIAPAQSSFSRKDLSSWETKAEELNRSGRGDQAAWVLQRS